MDPFRMQPRNETDRRNRRNRGEDRWSRRSEYERDPIDPFEGQGEQEDWELDVDRGRRSFAPESRRDPGQTRYDRGFEELEDWQRPRQFSRPWDEGRRDPRRAARSGWFGEEPLSSRVPPYGYYEPGHAPRQRGWDIQSSDAERFGTRQPFGSGLYRSGAQDERGRFAPEREATGTHIGKGPKGYRRSDERIQEELSDRLTADPQVDASEISITVRQGEVTLEGSVSERSMKRAAEDLAEDINGVQEVHNRLRVEQRNTGETASAAERSTASQVGASHASGAATRKGETRYSG